jgi:hypothetical protein
MAKHGFVSFRSIGLSSFEQLDLLRSLIHLAVNNAGDASHFISFNRELL